MSGDRTRDSGTTFVVGLFVLVGSGAFVFEVLRGVSSGNPLVDFVGKTILGFVLAFVLFTLYYYAKDRLSQRV